MGLHLIAVTYDLNLLILILEVAFALGMVIFVHELGHFAVAKWCGVKVEKFYLGFDIYGLKLAKFTSGETEYGIGILPLGGYVKMLGQDDNPSRAAGERERSILRTPEGQPTPATSSDTLDADGERYQLDSRSYMAKSVPQRMAIISAGVIMNVIFAFVTAMIAYTLGVNDIACGISAVSPGEAAWRANLQPGDQIVRINDSGDQPLRFRDLMTAVALADMSRGIDFQIQREGVAEPFRVNVRPDLYSRRLRPTIGVANPVTTALADPHPVFDGTPAAGTGAFRPNDRIVAIDDQKVLGFADYKAQFVQHPDKPLRITIERQESEDATADAAKTTEQLNVEVPPRPIRSLGLAMKIGKITAIQADSPADKAGLRADDLIVAIDGRAPGDPLRLPDELRRRAPATIKLKIAREARSGQVETIEKEVTLREPRWSEESAEPGSPVGVPALGIAYKVSNVIREIQPGSPAATAELTTDGKPAGVARLAPNDEIVKADIILPEKPKQADKNDKQAESNAAKITGTPDPIKFGGDEMNWPFFNSQMQLLPQGSKYRLTLKDGREALLEAAEASDWFNPNRGFILSMEMTTTKAHSLGEAAVLARRETVDAVTQVYAFLRKIGSQISPYMLGGPKTIAVAAGGAASKGISELLIFLTMLSANLAVINFLPIPLLDGGHMVFLTLEGIFRRPVSERVVVAFHYLGFLFIISLMVFVLGLDFGLIPRG